MAPSVDQRSVVITGSSTGIGEALAVQLAREGWTVFAGVRKEADGDRLRSSNENIHPLFLDVTNDEQIHKAFAEVQRAVGERGLDALVNNAGIAYSGPTEFVLISDIEAQLNTNFLGAVRVTQAALPLLRMGSPGRIVNVGSTVNKLNLPYFGPYSASKAALESFNDCLRREVSPWGIKVVMIKPGPVKTNFEHTALKIYNELKSRFPPGSTCHDLYGKELDGLSETMDPFRKAMASSSKAACTIKNVLNTRNPRSLYYDTWGTYFAMRVVKWMPARLYDYIIDLMFKRKR